MLASTKKKLFVRAALLISFALLAWIFSNIDISKFIGIFANIRLPFLILSLSTLLIELLFKAFRLKILVETYKESSFRDNFIVTLVGLPFGLVTPGRFGDLIKIDSLAKRTSLPPIKCIAVGVIEKVLDFISLIALASLGILYMLVMGKGEALFYGMIAFVVIIGLAILIFLNKRIVGKFVKFFLKKTFLKKYEHSITINADNFYTELSSIFKEKEYFMISVVIAFFLWFNRIVRIFLVALTLGLEINLAYLFLVIPMIDIIEIMPLAVMGLGTREYAYIFLLSLGGISREESLALSLLAFFLVAITFSVAGYIAVLKEYKEHH